MQIMEIYLHGNNALHQRIMEVHLHGRQSLHKIYGNALLINHLNRDRTVLASIVVKEEF